MERSQKGVDFSRPPPTSPRSHPKKKPRREGPPRPRDEFHRDDAEWSRPPPSASPHVERFQHDEGARESKPHHLGAYVIQQQGPPPPPEFKIRGRSLTEPKAEECDDNAPSVTGLEKDFLDAVSGIYEHLQDIQPYIISSGCPRNHAASRAPAKIKGQLNRLNHVYWSIKAEAEGLMNEVDQFAAREDELKRELGDSRSANFKLSCAKKDFSEQIHDLRSAAVETEAELYRLKREVDHLEAKHERLEDTYCKLKEERGKISTQRLRLEETVRKRDADIEQAVAENRRLQSLVQDRDKQVEDLKASNLGLRSLVQRHEGEAEQERAENARLQAVVCEKEARITSLTALPITPLSPLPTLGAFPFSTRPILQPTSQPEQAVTPRPVSPNIYIKQENPDQTSAEGDFPPQGAPAEQPEDPAQQLYQLGTGAANILGKLFQINHPTITYSDTLVGFLARLGATPDASSINVTRATGFWQLEQPWTPTPPVPPKLRPTLEEQFTQLCLLFPFAGKRGGGQPQGGSSSSDANDPATFSLLASLLTSLIKADYSASPYAGLAFLHTMISTLSLHPPLVPETEITTAHTALLTLMLDELCRALEETYYPNDVHRRWNDHWGGATAPGSVGGASARGVSAVRQLAAALGEPDGLGRSVGALKERLVGGCGDRVCFLGVAGGVAAAGGGAEEREIGLLHCGGEGGDFFLVMDLGERSLRLVDCRLAGMRPNGAEPRKLDLIVARSEEHEEEAEELFRVAAAPRDVAAFWVRYAMGDV
ncbi:hypothetical protein C8A00DRAFT_13587 [Chaetomidium leptoderma]|uniref:Uncharacterized protein n=1 Tax=Chaetomidium leptoderma TaxID=669021 RepID=A0AAN6VRA5_9PEZI|nr:hypothetical protein C8A00DRAFT_13587 [Chaetomidium leptoderma]